MITDIRLQRFRSYTDESFEFIEGVNIIVGPNTSGKTNLLEAILVIARGSSYRARDSELVQFNKPWAKVEAHTAGSDSRVVQIQLEDGRASKAFKLDGQALSRLSLPKTLPIVLFEPNHLQLLAGAPELRRQFLDDLLEQITPGFAGVRRQYKRTLNQRNALLKQSPVQARPQLFAWNVRLSELGAQIVTARLKLVEAMREQLGAIYKELARSKAVATMAYESSVATDSYATNLLRMLEAHEATDFARGFTAYGPHRDDLQVFIDGHLAQDAASRGEIRTLLLVYKVLEVQLLEQARDMRPILLLDDVFSELDGGRRQALTQFLQPYQTFITTTDADVVIQHFTEVAKVIPTQSISKQERNNHKT